MSKGKGLTLDGMSDNWFKECKKVSLINNVWTKDVLREFGSFGSSRLIPLNKVYPGIPEAGEFRPIVI